MTTAYLSKSPHERAKALAGVALLHILLGYAFITGLRGDFAAAPAEAMKLFEVAPEPPPPPVVTVAAARSHTPEGAASPPSRKARPAPVVAPPPRIRLPAPPVLPVADKPSPLTGSDRSAGAAPVDGPGSGAGGAGSGTGSGGSGTGLGSGGARRAERLSGRIANEDYPRAALRARAQGSVRVRYTVGADGRAGGCTVTRSTAGPDLDALTCRLVEQRFRYRPATDSSGRPIAEAVSKTYDWILPGGL
jgi:protein TonB